MTFLLLHVYIAFNFMRFPRARMRAEKTWKVLQVPLNANMVGPRLFVVSMTCCF